MAPVREVARLTNGEVLMALVANRPTASRPLFDIAAVNDRLRGDLFGAQDAACEYAWLASMARRIGPTVVIWAPRP